MGIAEAKPGLPEALGRKVDKEEVRSGEYAVERIQT